MSQMQAANSLRNALLTGSGLSFGAWQMLPGANHARMMARSGYDWICVDTEHGNIAGALDSGAHGIVVPLIYTTDDARKLVESAKFPPVGRRGFGSPFAMGSTGGVSGLEYLQQSNDALLTIVQIETKEALENVEEIAKVPGIDVLFVGPWDLGNNIGRPVLGEFHDDLNAAIERIRKAAVNNGKKSGIYCVGGAPAKKYAEQGFHMISVVADVVALPTFLSDALGTAKGSNSKN